MPSKAVLKSDVEMMIRNWQSECDEIQTLYNQGNVLIDRLEALSAAEGVARDILPMVHLIGVFADDMTERNWADKRLYIKEQADRIRSALQEGA